MGNLWVTSTSDVVMYGRGNASDGCKLMDIFSKRFINQTIASFTWTIYTRR